MTYDGLKNLEDIEELCRNPRASIATEQESAANNQTNRPKSNRMHDDFTFVYNSHEPAVRRIPWYHIVNPKWNGRDNISSKLAVNTPRYERTSEKRYDTIRFSSFLILINFNRNVAISRHCGKPRRMCDEQRSERNRSASALVDCWCNRPTRLARHRDTIQITHPSSITLNMFTKGSHHRIVSVVYLAQNLFPKNKSTRTMSLNAHYMVLFKHPKDATQFANLARQCIRRGRSLPWKHIRIHANLTVIC